MHSAVRISSYWPNNYWTILRKPPRPTTGKDTQKRPALGRKKGIFHRDNARPHTSAIAMAKLHELRYELLPNPPYSSDLAPTYFHLFSKLENFLGGCRFLTAELERYFACLEESNFQDGIKALEHRWTKCISLQRDYVEK
ncbi:histone-lysine N-methyltransferase SETMAR-like [Halyomorpha halys]|uniref:histone-lysine N-methyltransferase SETMAR-like n=1 Tax=Halyomorpha halys TaxID=286706 RepID=UPI0006D4E51C|nr:histone-lysine N-methyltransferase SETMAR-like [Halyomorpha halys]